jgi:hypothetical protein
MKVKKVLIAARKLIKDPKNWTIAVYARNIRDEETDPTSKVSCKWCSKGAIQKACFDMGCTSTDEMKSEQTLRVITGDIVRFNDNKSHSEVLEAFDKAIKRLKNDSDS